MRNISTKVFFSLVLTACLISGCGWTVSLRDSSPEVVEGSGSIVEEDRMVRDFSSISVVGTGEVIITQNGEEGLTVRTDDNIMPLIKSDVIAGTLVLGFTAEARDKSLRPSDGIVFILTVDDLDGMEITGSGDVTCSSLESDRFGIEVIGSGDIRLHSLEAEKLEIGIAGSGDIRIDSLTADEIEVTISGSGELCLAGETRQQEIVISGSGDVEARDLSSQEVKVSTAGSGNATIWAIDRLIVRISGSGNVWYFGKPLVSEMVSGSGGAYSLGRR
jgi:hypothetical protein